MSEGPVVKRLHVCDSCQYAQHKTMIRPSESAGKSVYCHVCGHLGIGSTVDCVKGEWLSTKVLMSNYTKQGEDNGQ